jgi:low temperature requirement protein LtrA
MADAGASTDPTVPGAAPSDLTTARPGEERVSTLELLFDLVFVFAFTQITGSISHEPTAVALGHGLLVFAVLWWAWGAYAWLTNTVPTGEIAPRVVVFGAMAAMLVTALAVPTAFDDGGPAFALGYLVVMVLHAALFTLAGENPETTRRAVVRLSLTNFPAALALVGAAYADGTVQTVLWVAAVAVCYAGPYLTGVAGFTVHPAHFVERHGLIVIIALGESVVAIGAGSDEITLNWPLAGTGLVVIALVIGFWWAYFDTEATAAERALTSATGAERSRLARDIYSYLHIPLVLGIVLSAVGIHEALLHPGDPLDAVVAGALGAGVALFFAALAAIRVRRGARPGPLHLAGVVAAGIMAPVAAEIAAWASFAVLAAVVLAIDLGERWMRRGGPARGQVLIESRP